MSVSGHTAHLLGSLQEEHEEPVRHKVACVRRSRQGVCLSVVQIEEITEVLGHYRDSVLADQTAIRSLHTQLQTLVQCNNESAQIFYYLLHFIYNIISIYTKV